MSCGGRSRDSRLFAGLQSHFDQVQWVADYDANGSANVASKEVGGHGRQLQGLGLMPIFCLPPLALRLRRTGCFVKQMGNWTSVFRRNDVVPREESVTCLRVKNQRVAFQNFPRYCKSHAG